jgi:hypothetical protein
VSCTMSIQRSYGLFLVNSSPNQMLLNYISYNPITHSRVSTQNEKIRFFAVTLQECCWKNTTKTKREQRFHDLKISRVESKDET